MFNYVQTPVLIPSRSTQKPIPIGVDRHMHKILHSQAFSGLLNSAYHPLLACELLASVTSPSDPSELTHFDSEGAFFIGRWG